MGEYEIEYDSGEFLVCDQINTELPYSGFDFQSDDSENNIENQSQDSIFDNNDEDKLYNFDELNSYLRSLSEDDSGDVYYYFIVYRNNIVVGKIDMYYISNTHFDLTDNEIKTSNCEPYYSYTLTLYEDSEESFSSENTENPFNDSKFRCKKCGKVFCTCNKFFTING